MILVSGGIADYYANHPIFKKWWVRTIVTILFPLAVFVSFIHTIFWKYGKR